LDFVNGSVRERECKEKEKKKGGTNKWDDRVFLECTNLFDSHFWEYNRQEGTVAYISYCMLL
jgi:hypothetical protein